MEFQVIDYAEEKLPLFLFLYHLDSTDLHCQRAWISEALALHQTGFFMSGGQTQPGSDSYRRGLVRREASWQGFPYPFCLFVSVILSALPFILSVFRSLWLTPLYQSVSASGNANTITFPVMFSVKNSFINFTNYIRIRKMYSFSLLSVLINIRLQSICLKTAPQPES